VPALRNVTMRVTFGVPVRTADAGDAVSQRVLAEMRRLIERFEAQPMPVGHASRST
jgi:hypothetical protein